MKLCYSESDLEILNDILPCMLLKCARAFRAPGDMCLIRVGLLSRQISGYIARDGCVMQLAAILLANCLATSVGRRIYVMGT